MLSLVLLGCCKSCERYYSRNACNNCNVKCLRCGCYFCCNCLFCCFGRLYNCLCFSFGFGSCGFSFSLSCCFSLCLGSFCFRCFCLSLGSFCLCYSFNRCCFSCIAYEKVTEVKGLDVCVVEVGRESVQVCVPFVRFIVRPVQYCSLY